jgi:phosphotriesterase-related protein
VKVLRTVSGDVSITDTRLQGFILAHEHLQIDLSHNKSTDNVLGIAEEADIIADLEDAKIRNGLCAVADLSVPGSGRDVEALHRIATHAGIAALAATGLYWEPAPAALADLTVDKLAELMIHEIEHGIDNTKIRAGVIKIGTDKGPPTPHTARVFAAAAAAARATGAAIITHTSTPDQAAWQLKQLLSAEVPPARLLISHLHKFKTVKEITVIARQGVTVGIDQIGFTSGPGLEALADLVAALCDLGVANHLILSSDMARRSRLRRHGGTSYGTVFSEFVPRLQARRVSSTQIEQMLHGNPLALLAIDKT